MVRQRSHKLNENFEKVKKKKVSSENSEKSTDAESFEFMTESFKGVNI
jgi:hypothetical protein